MTIFYPPQFEHELLHTYWNRLRDFIVQYGYDVGIREMCHMIYDGVNDATRASIEGMCHGVFNYLSYDERWELLKHLAQNSEESEVRSKAQIENITKIMLEMIASMEMYLRDNCVPNIDSQTSVDYDMSDSSTSIRDDLDFLDDDDDDEEVSFPLETPPQVVEVDPSANDNLEVHSWVDGTIDTGGDFEPNYDILESLPFEEGSLREEECDDQMGDSWAAQVDAIEAALIGNEFGYAKTQNMEDLALSLYTTEVIPTTLDICVHEDSFADHVVVVHTSPPLCISTVFKTVNLIPSSPLLYPPSCLTAPSYAHNTSEMFDVSSLPIISLHFDTTRGRPPDQGEWTIDNDYWSVVEYWGLELPSIPRDLDFDAPCDVDLWSNLVIFHVDCHGMFDKLKRSLTLILHAYILRWCYLCFCTAHAQVFDRLLRALNGFDLSYYA